MTEDNLLPFGDRESLDKLFENARTGCHISLGTLLEQFRPFLLQLANDEMKPQMKSKVGGSDLVQQSLMEAGECFADFQGKNAIALGNWLRSILLNNAANLRRHYHTEKRDVGREVRFTGTGSGSNRIDSLLDNMGQQRDDVVHREEAQLLEAALQRLPEDSRLVIQLRNQDRKSFQEIGDVLGRSSEAARKTWARAIEALKRELGDERLS